MATLHSIFFTRRSLSSQCIMGNYWTILFLYTLVSITVVSGWKWHVETGPSLPAQPAQDEDTHQLNDHSGRDSNSFNVRNSRRNHRSKHGTMQADQAYSETEDIVSQRSPSSGIQSHFTDKDPIPAGTTEQYQVRRSHNSKEMQQHNKKEVNSKSGEDELKEISQNNTVKPAATKETNSPEVYTVNMENVSKANQIRNTLGVPQGIPPGNSYAEASPEEPAVLQNLVATLQEQLIEAQTSQVRTRSILNVIQETQETQAKDLQTLKDSIEEIRQDQVRDQQSIRELQKIAEDNAWGVSDLKTTADLIRSDFTAFKALQLSHNDTMIELETLAVTNEIDHDKYQNSIKHIQHEIHTIKNQMQQDRSSLNQLSNQFELATRQGEYSSPVPNNIPALPDGGSFEGSGDKSGEVNREFDQFASSIEERHNIIGHRIRKILAKERKMEQDMVHVQERFTLYENDLSKLYGMFFNLSSQMTALEKRTMDNQHVQFKTELQTLQQGFVNFSQQLLSLQQWHSDPSGSSVKPYLGTESHIVDEMMDVHERKMEDIKHSILETKAAGQQTMILVNNRIALLNNTIRDMRKLLTDHNIRATDAFEDVGGRVMDFNTRIQHNDDRLTRLEVKVLNATLEACQKSNSDLRQDNYLNSLERGLSKLNKRTDDLSDRVSKVERGVSNLYEVADTQGNSLSKIMDGIHTVMEQLPQIKGLKKEIQNFIMQLPSDCSAIREQNPTSESGPYLIHPKNSPGTAWVPCEFDTGDTWTVIQKRNSGELTFAKTWDEYQYGFGDPTTEYWLGNDNLHYLTNQKEYRLHISMWDLDGHHWYAEYDHFRVDDLEESYALHIDGYHGNATDAMKYSNYMPFSTLDHDNDVSSTHCAKFYTAGWWYKHCHYANLNGRYSVGIVWFNHDFDEWVQMQRTEMKIAPQPAHVRHYNLDNSTEEKDSNAT